MGFLPPWGRTLRLSAGLLRQPASSSSPPAPIKATVAPACGCGVLAPEAAKENLTDAEVNVMARLVEAITAQRKGK